MHLQQPFYIVTGYNRDWFENNRIEVAASILDFNREKHHLWQKVDRWRHHLHQQVFQQAILLAVSNDKGWKESKK
jgi:hypothetical protein